MIFSILTFIFGLIGNFNSSVGGVNVAFQIIILIIIYLALGDIKEIGFALNNRELLDFRSKLITAFLIYIIGYIFFIGGLAGLIAVLVYSPYIAVIIILAVVLLLGIIILIVAAILRIQAWSKCNDFFKQNTSMFPPNIANDAIEGSKFMKYAAILYFTIILSFIGGILELIGYFKLSSLKNLQGTTTQPYATSPAPGTSYTAPPPKQAEASGAKFCPNCGSPVSAGQKFCPSCGSEM